MMFLFSSSPKVKPIDKTRELCNVYFFSEQHHLDKEELASKRCDYFCCLRMGRRHTRKENTVENKGSERDRNGERPVKSMGLKT